MTYQQYLKTLGIEMDSPEEIKLLEQVFDVDFQDEGCDHSAERDYSEEHQGHHHQGCNCGCCQYEEISDQELIEAVSQYLEQHGDELTWIRGQTQ